MRWGKTFHLLMSLSTPFLFRKHRTPSLIPSVLFMKRKVKFPPTACPLKIGLYYQKKGRIEQGAGADKYNGFYH